MAPFFLKQYVRSHASNVFEAYPKLLTEMALMRRSRRLVKNPALTSTRPGFTCYASS
jgi:E3 ubiquitin-protein ligase UBR4